MKKNMKLFKNRTIQAILLVLAGLFSVLRKFRAVVKQSTTILLMQRSSYGPAPCILRYVRRSRVNAPFVVWT